MSCCDGQRGTPQGPRDGISWAHSRPARVGLQAAAAPISPDHVAAQDGHHQAASRPGRQEALEEWK